MKEELAKNCPELYQLILNKTKSQKKPIELSITDYKNMRSLIRTHVGKDAAIEFYYQEDKVVMFGHIAIPRGESGFMTIGLHLYLSETPEVYVCRLVKYSAETSMMRVP